MKELSIEEKSKRYDEALEKARQLCAYPTTKPFISDLQDLFPELAESEDERIRKEIIAHIKWCEDSGYCAKEEMIRWITFLEKHGEQKLQGKSALEAAKEEKVDNQNCVKPVDKVEPKFHEGDIIKPKDGGHEPWQIMQVDMFDKKYRFKDGYVVHFSQEDAYELVEQKPAWSEEDEEMLKMVIKLCEQCGNEYAYYWLKSLKDRVQPKQEWSEEDENTRKKIINFLKEQNYFDGKANEFKEPYKKEYE